MSRGIVWKAVAAVGVVAALGTVVWFGRGSSETHYTTFEVRRGPLDIQVLEGGSLEALESQQIKSQVRGYQGVKILYIVDEGYTVTEQDVEDKLKLVELDTSELVEKLTTSEISFRGTQASLTEAEKGFDIQVNLSESEIYGAELESKFALLEMEKYLGDTVTPHMMTAIKELEDNRAALALEEEALALEEAASDDGNGEENVEEDPLAGIEIDDLRLGHPDIDFSSYASLEVLGSGEASQLLRKLDDDLAIAKGELSQAAADLEGKERLHDREFITKNELESAQLKMRKHNVSVQTAETAKALFVQYEFAKQAEKLVSDYIQAERKLSRTEQEALSKLAQAKAKLLSSQARFSIEQKRIEDYRDQIAKATMVAERSGLVVYGGSGPRYWDAEPIKEGALVREKQAIITIPDMSTMAVQVNIHESEIKKVKVGMRAEVRVEAFSDRLLGGEVVKVGVLPDSENRWMNPDMKVYKTTIAIDGTYEWLKPGMSAEVEIMVAHLDDATYIPIQSVVPQGSKRVCFVIEDGTPVRREIETGELTLEFIVVTRGLSEGEHVLIRPPEGSRTEEDVEGTEEDPAAEDTGLTEEERQLTHTGAREPTV